MIIFLSYIRLLVLFYVGTTAHVLHLEITRKPLNALGLTSKSAAPARCGSVAFLNGQIKRCSGTGRKNIHTSTHTEREKKETQPSIVLRRVDPKVRETADIFGNYAANGGSHPFLVGPRCVGTVIVGDPWQM